MTREDDRQGRGQPHGEEPASIDDARRRAERERLLVRRALEQAAGDREPDVSGLLAAVPEMMAEAARRRGQAVRRDALTASIPLARVAIPRLAAAALLLIALTAVVLLRGANGPAAATDSFEEMLIGGNTVSADRILESILGPEE